MEYPATQPVDPLAAVWAGSAEPARPLTPGPGPSAAGLDTRLPEAVNLWRTEELLDRGLSARQILRLTACGALVKRRRGCYVRRRRARGRHRVTSLARTAADSCLVLIYAQGLILMDHALRLGAGREAVELECARLRGAPGVSTLKKVLAHADPLSESPGETLLRDLVRRLRLPAPQLQFEVRTRLGTYRLDCAWPERLVALEFDGRGKYFDYDPTAEAIFAERRREKALMELGLAASRPRAWTEPANRPPDAKELRTGARRDRVGT